jgi:hypothetical protein
MIDSATVTRVAADAHIIINAATVTFLAAIGIVTYFIGLFRGKKVAGKPAAAETKK